MNLGIFQKTGKRKYLIIQLPPVITEILLDPENGVIKNTSEIFAIGHRVVHGGDKFSETIVIDSRVKEAIKDLFSLAPLHNPPNLKGIEVAEEVFPQASQVAVFDTAFHRSIPFCSNQICDT
jgi:acetate kinase